VLGISSDGVSLLLPKRLFSVKDPAGLPLLENLPLACPLLPPLLRRAVTFLNLAQASPVSEAMLLSRAGSCCWDWESRVSTRWQLSTAALLATSTSSMAEVEKQPERG